MLRISLCLRRLSILVLALRSQIVHVDDARAAETIFQRAETRLEHEYFRCKSHDRAHQAINGRIIEELLFWPGV
ncbi:MAG: hypothetical protein WD448_05790 [Woeseia sp.]